MINKNQKFIDGFTIIELLVVVAIVAVLSSIIMFSVQQYANKAKDSNVAGNLAVLIPAGETYYGINNNSYDGFCDVSLSTVVKNAISQMPVNITNISCYNGSTNQAGLCCRVAEDGQSWAACAKLFSNTTLAYCVDSRGIKKQISSSLCTNTFVSCD